MIFRRLSRLSDRSSALKVRARPESAERREPVKGCMRNMIVVKPPDPRFTEALFILRDDYFQNTALSRGELLRQARSAAGDCARSIAPPVRRRFPLYAALLTAGAGAALVLLLVFLL